ncbi:MAG: prepilin-type N-terminal cleavage/methylation domain-containing protein [Planctomycetota bacterium]
MSGSGPDLGFVRHDRGLTLIEVLVATVLLAVLATVLVSLLRSAASGSTAEHLPTITSVIDDDWAVAAQGSAAPGVALESEHASDLAEGRWLTLETHSGVAVRWFPGKDGAE